MALCLTVLCVGAISANAAVYTTMADEITLFENLGFDLPEKTNEADAVTRAEFVGTITQFFNRDFAPGGTYSFEDVPKDGELSGALSYAVAMGIVSDDTLFNPDANVTYPQAMKMAVAFLGRGAEAEYLGGYDGGGYSAVASTLKLYSGLQDGNGEFVTLRDFYKILYNVGQADMLVRDSHNNLVNGNSPFVEYFNMYEIKGILNASDATGLKDNENIAPKGMIKVDKSIFYYDGDIPMGYYVNGWASYSAMDNPTAVLVKPYRNETFTTSLVDFEARQDGGYIYYLVKGREEKIRIDNPALLYNGVSATGKTLDEIINSELGDITFIDNDSDGYYEVISVDVYRPVVVSATSTLSMRILDKNGEPTVELDDGGRVKRSSIKKDGVDVPLSSIVTGDVLKVYESPKNEIVKVEVVSTTTSGKVTSHNATTREIKLGETVYKYSTYFEKYYYGDIKPNDELEVAVTNDNVIHAIVVDLPARNSYGYIISEPSYNEITEKHTFKLACADGEVRRVEITEKTQMDGATGISAISANISRLFNYKNSIGEDEPVARFIKYRLNPAMDEILIIDTHTPLEGVKNKDGQYEEQKENVAKRYVEEKSDNDMLEFTFPQNTSRNPGYQNGSWTPHVNVVATTKVFKLTIADDLDDDEIFTVASKSDVNSNLERAPQSLNYNFNRREYRIYNVDTYGSAEAVLIIKDSVSSDLAYDSAKGVVYRMSEAADIDGDKTYQLVIYNAGQYKTFFTDEDLYEDIKAGTKKLEQGDYITYCVNGNDEITDAMWIYDHDANGAKLNPEALVVPSGTDGKQTILTTANYLPWISTAVLPGWIYEFNGNTITMLATGHFNGNMTSLPAASDQIAGLGRSFIPASSATTCSIISNVGNGRVGIQETSVADLKTYTQLSFSEKGNADYAIMLLNNGVLQEILIFR